MSRLPDDNQNKPSPTRICAWCSRMIGEDEERWSFGAKSRPEVDLTHYEGSVIALLLPSAQKIVHAIVPTAVSEASQQGYDLVFMTCSEECALMLKDALSRGMELSNGQPGT